MNAVVPDNVLDRSDASCGRREHDPQDIFQGSGRKMFFRKEISPEENPFRRRASSGEERLQRISSTERRASSGEEPPLGEELLQERTSSEEKVLLREACAGERGEDRLLSLSLTLLEVQVLSPTRVQNSEIWRNRGVRKIIPI